MEIDDLYIATQIDNRAWSLHGQVLDAEAEEVRVVGLVMADNEIECEVPEHMIIRAVNMFPKGSCFDLVFNMLGRSINVIRSLPDMVLYAPLLSPNLRNGRPATQGAIVLKKSFEGLDVEFEFDKAMVDDICNVSVHLVKSQAEKSRSGLRVDLFSGERELASYPLAGSKVSFDRLCRGEYRIQLTSQGSSLGSFTVQIT